MSKPSILFKIIAVLSLTLILSSCSEKPETLSKQEAAHILNIAFMAGDLYIASADYKNLSNSMLDKYTRSTIEANGVPATPPLFSSPWQGTITIAPTDDNKGFTITETNIPKDICNTIVSNTLNLLHSIPKGRDLSHISETLSQSTTNGHLTTFKDNLLTGGQAQDLTNQCHSNDNTVTLGWMNVNR